MLSCLHAGAVGQGTSLSSAQIRGARGMLDWSMTDLAEAAGVSVSTVKRMERGAGQPVSEGARTIVRTALERAGMVLTEDDGWAGVKMRIDPT